MVKLSRHFVAKQARHVTRQHTHSLCLHTGLYYGISESLVGHSTLLVAYLVPFVRNGWRTLETHDTVMEARGPSNVNTVDTAAPQPPYSLRSTDKINRGESLVTRIDPHHCTIAETELQHGRPRSPDLTVASLPGSMLMSYPHTLTGDRSVDVDVDISPLGPDSVALPASANTTGRSDSWQSNVIISSLRFVWCQLIMKFSSIVATLVLR